MQPLFSKPILMIPWLILNIDLSITNHLDVIVLINCEIFKNIFENARGCQT
jgi:hypothetical protein